MSVVGWIGFVLAGALGATARYVIGGLVDDRNPGRLPWGTFVVNVSGTFVLGLLSGLALYHGFPDAPRTVLGTGFCGAYTTFSTFTFDTVRLIEEGDTRRALVNTFATLVVGVVAATAGLVLASR